MHLLMICSDYTKHSAYRQQIVSYREIIFAPFFARVMYFDTKGQHGAKFRTALSFFI